jgi:ATP-binding cassette subfamily B protein
MRPRRTLIRRLRPFGWLIFVVAAGLLAEMGFNGALPLMLRFLIDSVLSGKQAADITFVLWFLAAGAVAASVLGGARDRSWARLQAGVISGIRQEMLNCLQRLPFGFFQSDRGGDVLSVFSNDLSTIENAASMCIPWGLLPGLECVFGSILLLALDWRLWLAAMMLWPWTILAPRLFTARAERSNAARHGDEAGLLTELQENLGAQAVVKAFGLESLRISSFARLNRAWTRSATRAGVDNSMLERSTTSGILLIQIAVLGIGAWLALHHRITVGTLVSFQALLLLLSNNLLYVMQYMPSLLGARAAMTRIEELLATPAEASDLPDAVEAPENIGALEFHGVTFGYAPGYLTLHNVSLRIPRGASVAFVGGSGCGKSTILNLLMRFYDPLSGSITVEGRDIRSFTLASWRRRFGAVFQESLLFNRSVFENIRMARPGAADEEVRRAARDAEIHTFIERLPQGYQTPVGERGGRLSGGQRQRVSIARAILRDPAVLVLDEATSALDPGTEAAVNETLERLARGRTSIAVTHRLANAARMDQIFVLERGRLAESGSHLDLLAGKGLYATLWQKQNGFDVSDDGASASIRPERLVEIPILKKLSTVALATLAPMFRSAAFRAGEDIVVEGDSSGGFYILVRGRAEVLRNGSRVATLDDGDFFGEIALLTGSPRMATVRALNATICITLDKEAFDALLEQDSELKKSISETARRRAVA